MTSARTTSRRNWCAGATSWSATTTTTTTAARCCMRLRKSTSGAWRCWSTRRITCSTGHGACTARRSIRRRSGRAQERARRRCANRLNGCSANGMRSIARRPTPIRCYPDVPPRFSSAAQNLIGAVTEQLAEAPLSIDEASTAVSTSTRCISSSLAEQFGEHSVFDITLTADRYAPTRQNQRHACACAM